MVVNEKALVREMKEAWKRDGYEIANRTAGGVEEMVLNTAEWTVVIRKEKLPRKVLGLIAEHLGEIPGPGDAWLVKKKETQTEIYQQVVGVLDDYHTMEKGLRIIRRTSLTMGGSPLWQAASDHKVILVNPDLEDLMEWGTFLVRISGDEHLIIDDMESRCYIRCKESKDTKEIEKLNHLAKVTWVSA